METLTTRAVSLLTLLTVLGNQAAVQLQRKRNRGSAGTGNRPKDTHQAWIRTWVIKSRASGL